MKTHVNIIVACAMLGLLALLAAAGPAAATPPSAVDLSFDREAHVLSVTITHDSENTKTHYIYKVEIKKNGVTYNTTMYTSQPDSHRFTYTFNVSAGAGDRLAATAGCVVFGSLSSTLDVSTGKTSTTGGSAYSLWPFHATMMVTGVTLGALAVAGIYMKKKPWWFTWHKALGAAAGALMASGVLTAAYMIAASGGTQFRVPHAWLGLTLILLVVTSLSLGAVYVYSMKSKRTVRGPHLWLGRAITALEVLEILMGLALVGILAAP